jgi:hypothetical protein
MGKLYIDQAFPNLYSKIGNIPNPKRIKRGSLKMAKKNDEEMFEDYEEEAEEKKPKKKGGKKRKKAVKIIAWVVAFVVILAILLFIRFKYAAPEVAPEEAPEEEAPPEEVEEAYVPAPEETVVEAAEEAPKHIGPDVVPKEDLPQVQEVVDTSELPELFSNLRCEYDENAGLLYMSLRIYNVLDEDIKISPKGVQKGYNTYFLIRGVVDTDPGCGTELVQPGEYTDCRRIGFDTLRYGNVPGINRISVQVPGKTEALLIECPELPEDAEENAPEQTPAY